MNRRQRIGVTTLGGLYALSLLLPFLVGARALLVRYEGNYYTPVFRFYSSDQFGGAGSGEPDYRALRTRLAEEAKGNWAVLPPYPYGAAESLLDEPGAPPHAPSLRHWLGTDDRGRDVLARLAYGFQVSLTFALVTTLLATVLGIAAGALFGYAGGVVDLLGQRFVEIWSALPVLFVVMIVSGIALPANVPGRMDLLQPPLLILTVLLAAFEWPVITQYVRSEFAREKARDYVAAARASGATPTRIIARHVLRNAVTPVLAFAPFMVIGNITSLTALDFLGFGLPAPSPSWGETLSQGLSNPAMWWLIAFPASALVVTLGLVSMLADRPRSGHA